MLVNIDVHEAIHFKVETEATESYHQSKILKPSMIHRYRSNN